MGKSKSGVLPFVPTMGHQASWCACAMAATARLHHGCHSTPLPWLPQHSLAMAAMATCCSTRQHLPWPPQRPRRLELTTCRKASSGRGGPIEATHTHRCLGMPRHLGRQAWLHTGVEHTQALGSPNGAAYRYLNPQPG